MKLRIFLALLTGLALAWTAGTVGAQTTATGTAERTLPTTTVTETVTQPAQTVTASRTATVTQEASPTLVQVTPTTGSGSDEPSDDPLSTVAWILIGLAVLCVGIIVYQLGRRHHEEPAPAAPAA